MSAELGVLDSAAGESAPPAGPGPESPRALGSERIARWALPALLILLIVVFSLLEPDTFFTTDNLRTIAITQSVLAILAVAVLLPLIVGEFDLSVGANLGVAAILVTGLPAKQGLPLEAAIVLAVLASTAIGIVNGWLVAVVGINAFVATLGISTIATGLVVWYTDAQIIADQVPAALSSLAEGELLGVPLPVVYMLTIAVVVWYVLEQTPLGRYLFAIGGSKEAARLSGVNVRRLTLLVFAATGLLCGLAGVVQSAELGSGNPTVGPAFLLPAFAAAALGATAFHPGVFNVWGTLVAVFTIAVGVTGLQLVGVPFYIEPIFDGVALVLGVALTRFLLREAI